MAVTQEQIEVLKTFFLSVEIPATLKLNKATTQNNVAEQINEKVNLLETGELSEVVAYTFYEKLCQIKDAIETRH